MKYFGLILFITLAINLTCHAGTFVEGVPVSVQKSDYGQSIHLIFVQMQTPVNSGAQCDSQAGVVIHDSNESSKEALSFALTALASGSKFRCYVNVGDCSAVTGASTTYPVCDYYPALVK